MVEFLREYKIPLIVFFVVVVITAIGTTTISILSYPKPVSAPVSSRNPTMTNDEIIAEAKKCEGAGMKAYVRWWASNVNGSSDGVAEVVCLPKDQQKE
jgi:hypothetical protein